MTDHPRGTVEVHCLSARPYRVSYLEQPYAGLFMMLKAMNALLSE